MAARQCLKRLHLETHQPELKSISKATEAAFSTGHRVGEVARQIYDAEGSVYIPFEGGLSHALKKSARLLDAGPSAPIFEATLQYQDVLVRIDALLPDGAEWRIVEVKASTSVKDEHVFDCALQRYVFAGLGYRLSAISVAHIDNTFVYGGDGSYQGLLVEENLSEETAKLQLEIPDWIRRAREAAGPIQPDVAVGKQCGQPYECPFIGHCWPTDAEYPVQDLGGTRARLGSFIAAGFRDLRDVPPDLLTEGQRRIQTVTKSGRAELLPDAADALSGLGYPRYFLDFETIAPAVPLWSGTRPYEVLPFQWSCHYESSDSEVDHAGFLDLSGEAPMRRVAESLIRALGRTGPVFMYTNYEERVIRALADRFDGLAQSLHAIIARLFDLAPLTRANYYDPSMAGSWSLKAVIPAISYNNPYAELEGIQEGTEASEAYFEAIDPATPTARKLELEQQLLAYCKFDTQAMVQLVHFLADVR